VVEELPIRHELFTKPTFESVWASVNGTTVPPSIEYKAALIPVKLGVNGNPDLGTCNVLGVK